MRKQTSLHLTILIDNTVYMPSLRAEHGLSILAEADGVKVLLDAGQTAQVIQNARMLGVELASVSHVALSHGHFDHTGGLIPVLAKARSATLHAHPGVFGKKYARRDSGECQYIGYPGQEHAAKSLAKEVILDSAPQRLPSGFGLTGEVPRVHRWEGHDSAFLLDCGGDRVRDPLLDDQSLYWDGPHSVVVVTGCAHAGIVNTLEHVSRLTGKDRIHAVVGGLHLNAASTDRIDKTIEAFRRFGVERIGLGHCTGFRATQRIFDAFEGKCFLSSVGARECLGP